MSKNSVDARAAVERQARRGARRRARKAEATPAARYTAYDPFAGCYERHWCEEVPPAIFHVIETLLLPRLTSASRILDLCCGTGYTVARLETLGYDVTGLDGSQKMLTRARAAAPGSNFILADARSLTHPPTFDAVISTFDSLNHLMTLAELEAVMSNVHGALKGAGLFFFDMNMERGFLEHWADHFSIVEETEATILRGRYDRRERTGRYDITMFRLEPDGWRRTDALIMEKCYSMREIKGALRRAGFRKISAFDAERDLGLIDNTGRIFFLAHK